MPTIPTFDREAPAEPWVRRRIELCTQVVYDRRRPKKRQGRRRLSAEGLQEKLGTTIEQFAAYWPRSVMPCGSWAGGNRQAMSDVDLLIPRETETPFLDHIEGPQS